MRLASFGLVVSVLLSGCAGSGFGLESVFEDELGLLPISQSVEGDTYLFDFADVISTTPTGLANLLPVVDEDGLLVHVASEDLASLEIVLSVSDGSGSQSLCEPVHPIPLVDWTNPIFASGPNAVEFSLGGAPAIVEDFEIAGTFTDDGAGIEGFELSGLFDARHLTSADLGNEDICTVVSQLGGICEPCLDGEMTCVQVSIGVSYAERIEIDFDPGLDTSGC